PDLVHAEVRVRHFDLCRLPLPRVAVTRVLIGSGAGLIAPVDLRGLLRGPLLDGRIGLFQPLPYFLGVLLPGAAARSLRGITPTVEVRAHGPHGQVDREPLANQVTHGTAVP